MTLIQTWIPDYKYCILCGKETKEQACSENCANKLEKLSFTIKAKKESEKSGAKQWDQKTISDFNRIQDILG